MHTSGFRHVADLTLLGQIMWGNLHSSQMRASRGLENWLVWVGEAQKYLHFDSSLKSGFVQKFLADL